jgi:hypothetical protein
MSGGTGRCSAWCGDPSAPECGDQAITTSFLLARCTTAAWASSPLTAAKPLPPSVAVPCSFSPAGNTATA